MGLSVKFGIAGLLLVYIGFSLFSMIDADAAGMSMAVVLVMCGVLCLVLALREDSAEVNDEFDDDVL